MQSQRLIFLKQTSPDGERTMFVDGLGSIVTELAPTCIKMDSALGIKMMWTRNAPTNAVVMMQPGQTSADKIRDLKALCDDGVITEKQFEAKMAVLLEAM